MWLGEGGLVWFFFVVYSFGIVWVLGRGRADSRCRLVVEVEGFFCFRSMHLCRVFSSSFAMKSQILFQDPISSIIIVFCALLSFEL